MGWFQLLRRSIVRKQIVAVSGLVLVSFITGHLTGNLLIFLGPRFYNGYAAKLQGLGELLWGVRAILIVAALIHMTFTILVTLENYRVTTFSRYAVRATHGDSAFASRTMILGGLTLFFFIFLHLSDFTWSDKDGAASVIRFTNHETSLGLFGLVWNSFLVPWRAVFYVLAVWCVGLHLTHGIQSLFQTLGISHVRYTPIINRVSVVLGACVGLGFSAIPIYVNIMRVPPM